MRQSMKTISAQSIFFYKRDGDRISLCDFWQSLEEGGVKYRDLGNACIQDLTGCAYPAQRNRIVQGRKQRQPVDLALHFLIDQAGYGEIRPAVYNAMHRHIYPSEAIGLNKFVEHDPGFVAGGEAMM